jgi:hypothetical protein
MEIKMENLIKKYNGKVWEKNGLSRIYLNSVDFQDAKVFIEGDKLVIQNPYNRAYQNGAFNQFLNFTFDEVINVLKADIENLNELADYNNSNDYKAVFRI